MTKPPTQKVLTIILFLISKLHWWTRTKVTYIPYPLYYLPKYSRGGGVRTVPTRGDLKPLQIPVYLLMKHFRNWRARQPTNHYFEQPRTAATGNNCPPIPGPNQGMTLIPWVAKRQSYLYFTLVNFLKVSQPKCIFYFCRSGHNQNRNDWKRRIFQCCCHSIWSSSRKLSNGKCHFQPKTR